MLAQVGRLPFPTPVDLGSLDPLTVHAYIAKIINVKGWWLVNSALFTGIVSSMFSGFTFELYPNEK